MVRAKGLVSGSLRLSDDAKAWIFGRKNLLISIPRVRHRVSAGFVQYNASAKQERTYGIDISSEQLCSPHLKNSL